METGALPRWIIGVLFCIAGSTGAALGLIIQKYSHLRNAISSKPVNYLRQPRWFFGFALYMACQGLNLVAMGMAPLVVLSSLGAWCLISNALWARLLLGERLRRREVLTMVGTVGGVILVIESTPESTNPFPGDLNRMGRAFASDKFLWTTGGLVAMLLLLFFATRWCMKLRPAIWSLASAVFSGYTVLLWKCLSLLVMDPIPGAPQPWYQVGPYVIFIMGNLLGMGQVHTMNVGLRQASPLLVVPIFYTLGMLAQIATGAVFFDELENFDGAFQITRFWAGTVLLLICIFLLTKFKLATTKSEAPVVEMFDNGINGPARSDTLEQSVVISPWTWSIAKIRRSISKEGIKRAFSKNSVNGAGSAAPPLSEVIEHKPPEDTFEDGRLEPFDLFRVLDVGSEEVRFYTYWLDQTSRCICAAEDKLRYNEGQSFADQFVNTAEGPSVLCHEIARKFNIIDDKPAQEGLQRMISPTPASGALRLWALARDGALPGSLQMEAGDNEGVTSANPSESCFPVEAANDHPVIIDAEPPTSQGDKAPLLICLMGTTRQALCDDEDGRRQLNNFLRTVNHGIGKYGLTCIIYTPPEDDERKTDLSAFEWLALHGSLEDTTFGMDHVPFPDGAIGAGRPAEQPGHGHDTFVGDNDNSSTMTC